MGLLGPKIEWSEPWSWAKVRSCAAEIRREMPPVWRMLLYCAVLPLVVLVAALLYIRHVAPAEPVPSRLRWAFAAVPAIVVQFVGLPYLYALCPLGVIIRSYSICFIRGNSASHIKTEHISAICFRTIDGRRYFVVSGTTPKGKPLERKIEMPAEKVTEQDVVRFLYDAGLSHLYRTDELTERRQVW